MREIRLSLDTSARPVASLKTAKGHRSQARGHISKSTPTRVVTKSPSQPLTAREPGERCKFFVFLPCLIEISAILSLNSVRLRFGQLTEN